MHATTGKRQKESNRDAVKAAFDRLFDPAARRFDPEVCATVGCDRRPAEGAKFCGCCKEDRRTGRVVVFRGGELLPNAEMERVAFDGRAVHGYHQASR